MKTFLLVIISFLGLQNQSFAQPYSIPANSKKIVVLGNSITYAGYYVSCIDAYLRLQYPERHFEIINVGLPSETVSGLSEPNHADGKFPRPDLHERLDRVLKKLKPDLVLACYGMNDGIYLPFDNERFQKFCEGINWLHEEVIKSGASIIHITPPIYDERKGSAYANVLDVYSDWLISRRYTSDWSVIDVHWPMKKYLEDQRLKDSTFEFAADGIHPDNLGHFIIAKNILLGLGETKVANAVDMKDVLSRYKNGESIFQLVEKEQAIKKDSYLSSIGHKRPGMNVGFPLSEAERQCTDIKNQIQMIIKR
ncbi:SGNH/GDSL hydrolase family protein [Flavobacterium daemonense]|uniref:SGNH/GDSL hydrolase family protein n=1 Tax=Flavobacterium daemonense TaxID=1393049 RepID=UPI001185916D|nr:SGNH/GDSL hydrolase family protein [Flavobacterium daemonense]KAF2330625.1 SGNH/GDSL hydrolase family protein [Flavobacterium daemonense]